MTPRRILVTGGTGFIGSHLVRRLASEGHELHALHRPDSGAHRRLDPATAARLWPCDLADAERATTVLAAIRPEVIYHLAGDTGVRVLDPALASVTRSVESNVRASINLIVSAQAHCPDLQILIRLGGLEEYGRGPVPYVEGQREQPVSPYSASQVATTHYLQMLAPYLRYRVLTVRPALIYGPGQSTQFFIPALIDHCLKGKDFTISSGSPGRDLLYIDDIVEALATLREHSLPSGDILNFGAGREYLMADVAAAIVRLAAAKIRLLPGAPMRPTEIEHFHCSTHKAETLLGWRPAVRLEDGLRRTIAWFREQHDGARLSSP